VFKTLRGADLLGLGIVVISVIDGAHLLGARDPVTTVLLSIGWISPAAWRLIAWRRGHQPARAFPGVWRGSLMIGLALSPWMIAPALKVLFRSANLLSPLPLPSVLRIAGAVLMLHSVLRPFLGTSEVRECKTRYFEPLDAIGLFLASASPLVGALIVAALPFASSPRLAPYEA
jgi:hypothetical protein